MRRRLASPRLWVFGKSQNALVRLVDYQPEPTGLKSIVAARAANQDLTYVLPQLGEHAAMNSLIALTLGDPLGLDQRRLIARLETTPALDGRGKRHCIPIPGGEIVLIDDAYNANLTSMRAGLAVLAAMPLSSKGRRVVVLGEMLELGSQAASQHQELMSAVLSYPIDVIFAVGGSVMETAFMKKHSNRKGRRLCQEH